MNRCEHTATEVTSAKQSLELRHNDNDDRQAKVPEYVQEKNDEAIENQSYYSSSMVFNYSNTIITESIL